MVLKTFTAGLFTYFLLLLIGFGYSLYLAKNRSHPVIFCLGLAPILGGCLAVVVSVWCIEYEFSLRTMQSIMAIIAFISASIAFIFLKRVATSRKTVTKSLLWATLFFACMMIFGVICWNNYRHGFFYHHLAPDIAIYAANAIFFVKGSTMTDVTLPYVSEIIFNAHRWGFPYLAAFLTGTLSFNIFMMMQLVTFIFLGCSAWTIAWILSESEMLNFKEHTPTKYFYLAVTAACITANAALIYYMNEGFYPQIMTAAILNIIIALLIEGREKITTIILVIFLSAALISIYSESYALLLILLVASIAYNGCVLNIKNVRIDLLFLACAITAPIVVLPLSSVIIDFIINNSSNFNAIGYIQPGWILPSDVVGMSNIFTPVGKYLDDELSVRLLSISRHIYIYILSMWALYELLRLCYHTHTKYSSRIIILLLSGLGIFVINFALLHYSNYGAVNYLFDKLITNLAPIFTALFLLALFIPQRFMGLEIHTIKLTIAATFIFVSIISLKHDQKNFLEYVDVNSATLIAESHITDNYEILFNKRGYRHGEVVGRLRYIDASSEAIIGSILQRQPIDQWLTQSIWQCFSPRKEVAIIIRKSDLLNAESYLAEHKNDVLFDTPSYVVVRTHQSVSSMIHGSNSYDQYKKQFAI